MTTYAIIDAQGYYSGHTTVQAVYGGLATACRAAGAANLSSRGRYPHAHALRVTVIEADGLEVGDSVHSTDAARYESRARASVSKLAERQREVVAEYERKKYSDKTIKAARTYLGLLEHWS